jgi:lipopolysaccharide export system permease protein
MPLLVIGFGMSFFSFFFDDRVVIHTLKEKNDLSKTLLHQQTAENTSDIVIKAEGGKIIYSIDYYDSDKKTLNGLSIIETDDAGHFKSLIRAPKAVWKNDHWELANPIVYEYQGEFLRSHPLDPTDRFREQPGTFQRNQVKAEDLQVHDAGLLVKDLKEAGLPFTEALSDYYHRFSWSTVSFVVMILSISMGGRFKKNILLMSLLTSLGAAVVFYVGEMISMMMARLGYIPPIVGAWFPVVVFIVSGVALLRSAKT